MKKLFRKVWGAVKDAVGGINVGTVIGGAIGGAIGAYIGTKLQEVVHDYLLAENLSPHTEREVELWSDRFFVPYFTKNVEWLAVDDKNISSDRFVEKYNQVLLELRSWQAYYEAIFYKPTTTDVEKEIASVKRELLLNAVDIFKSTYEKLAVDHGSQLYFELQNYDPTAVKIVGGETLDWEKIGISAIKANNTFLTNGKETPQTAIVKSMFINANKMLPISNTEDTEVEKPTESTDNKETPPDIKIDDPLLDIPKYSTDNTEKNESKEAIVQSNGNLKKLVGLTAIVFITYKLFN